MLWQHIVLCKGTLLGMRMAIQGYRYEQISRLMDNFYYKLNKDAQHSQTHSQQRTLTQHDMLPQHPVNILELFCECF